MDLKTFDPAKEINVQIPAEGERHSDNLSSVRGFLSKRHHQEPRVLRKKTSNLLTNKRPDQVNSPFSEPEMQTPIHTGGVGGGCDGVGCSFLLSRFEHTQRFRHIPVRSAMVIIKRANKNISWRVGVKEPFQPCPQQLGGGTSLGFR